MPNSAACQAGGSFPRVRLSLGRREPSLEPQDDVMLPAPSRTAVNGPASGLFRTAGLGQVVVQGCKPCFDRGVAAADDQQAHLTVGIRQAVAGTSSASRAWTRLSMSSRMARTCSTGLPSGSSSSQSR
jgi:hypothetical protein